MGNLTLNGSTSGQITISPPAVAGTNTLTLPAATGTVLTTAGSQNVNTSIGINGATSGTVTLTVPAVAGTNTVTIAAQTGTLNAAGPAFSAYASADQTVTLSTATKIAIDTESFDTNSNFDTTTYRFTPTVAGYYQVNGVFRGIVATTFTVAVVNLYKNGAGYRNARVAGTLGAATPNAINISDIVYMNGTTDYLELYGSVSGTGTATFAGGAATAASFFSACLVRGA